MIHVAIYGLNESDKQFYRQQFINQDVSLDFYDTALTAQATKPQTTVLSAFVDAPITKEIIDALPKLKLIACRSTGVNNVDLAAAKERGIVVANVPNYGGTTVAEYAFTLLLMLTRHMPEVLYETTSTTPDRIRERGTDLFGKTLGVVGTGSIGLGAARIAKGFGMEVLAYDRMPKADQAKATGFTYCDSIDDLLCQSDIVTLHIPYTAENHHFLDRPRLGKMRHGAIVINTARGELIDTTALVDALRGGHVAAAALDVLESEYLMEPDRLIDLAAHNTAAKQTLRHAVSLAALQRMSNVIVTNHNAYNTVQALERINKTTAQNILNFIAGKEVHSI